MTMVFIVMFLITVCIAWVWANGIDNELKYRKENPDYKPGEGWLDWDCDKAHTEGEI